MEVFFNYIFAIMFPFGQDGWKVLSLVSVIFLFKYYKYWKKDEIVISLLVFLFYGLILSLFSTDIVSSFEEMQKYFIGWLFPFLLGYSVVSEKHKMKILKIYILFFVITILTGFLAYFNIVPDTFSYITLIKDNRLTVLCWHTVFGAKCGFIFIILSTLFIFNKNIDYMALVLCIIFFIAVLLSGTRAAYIAIFVSLILMICYYIYNRHSFVKICIVVLLFSVLFIIVYNTNPYLHKRIKQTSPITEKSLSQRIEMYKFGLKLINSSNVNKLLFGFGPLNSAKQEGNIYNLGHFHNIYLQIILDFGFIGFIFFILLIFFIFKKLIYLYKQTKSNLFLMLIFAWITILTSELFDCTLRHPFCAGQCFWITGLLLSGKKVKK